MAQLRPYAFALAQMRPYLETNDHHLDLDMMITHDQQMTISNYRV